MHYYFKCVEELADWLENSSQPIRKTYVRRDQEKRATKAIEESARSDGGFLLSYVMGIRCWTGLFKITGRQLRKSKLDGAWGKECPYYFDVKPIHVLNTPEKCFLLRESEIGSGHDGRGIYNQMRNAQINEVIRARIAKVGAMSDGQAKSLANSDAAFKGFQLKWIQVRDRSRTFTRWTLERAKSGCEICGVTKEEWIVRIPLGWRKAFDMNRIRRDDFKLLDGHHHIAVRDGGTAIPDNLIAICPNCHALLTRGGRRVRVKSVSD